MKLKLHFTILVEANFISSFIAQKFIAFIHSCIHSLWKYFIAFINQNEWYFFINAGIKLIILDERKLWSWIVQYPHGKCPLLANNDNAWNGVKSFFAQDINYVISTLNLFFHDKEDMSPHFYVMEYFLHKLQEYIILHEFTTWIQ